MRKSMFCWLGRTDLRAFRGELDEGALGPIGQAAKDMVFSEIHLLSDMKDSINSAYSKWLKQFTTATIAIHKCELSSPMNFSEIYEAVSSVLKKAANVGAHRVFHISPGTSAMAAIWIILSKTEFPAELIQSSPEEGVKVISIPFEMAAEYNSGLFLGKDDEILRISRGLPPEAPEFESIIHQCAAMKDAVMKSRIVALHDIPVLINGESGTGKELFARAIHASSLRNNGPFVEVNCGAIPESLFESEFFGHEKGAFTGAEFAKKGYVESADGGTLFLDEIGELPLQAQVKLLRMLQERKVTRVGATKSREVDFRIICATHRNLMKGVSEGNFREDLFHRIAIGVLKLPPLRERHGDISLLVDAFIEDLNLEFGGVHPERWVDKKLSVNARSALLRYEWPGNIRELRNTLSRLILWSANNTITTKDLKNAIFADSYDDTNLRKGLYSEEVLMEPGFKLEKFIGGIALEYIEKALKKCDGKKSAAAKMLGFSNYQTLDNWLKKHKNSQEKLGTG